MRLPVINKLLGWLGCGLVCGGALSTALQWDPLNIILLNIGALVYLVWGVRTRQMNQVIVNGVLLFIYGAGAYIRM